MNYLDFIPEYKRDCIFIRSGRGEITVLLEHRGFFNWIAQKFFKKMRVTNVHLDEMGNFIWPLIDGKKSIYDISLLVAEAYGEKAEPLYERLVLYMRTLKNYGFIIFK